MTGCAGAQCKMQGGEAMQLSQLGKDCNVSLELLLFSASDGKAELMEVGASVGLSEGNQGPEDITPYEVANILLHTVELFASAAAGSASVVRGGWQQSNLGKRALKFAHGLLALKAGVNVNVIAVLADDDGMVVEAAAELAQGTDSLLPVTLDLGNTTLVADEVFNIAKPEAVLISKFLGSSTG